MKSILIQAWTVHKSNGQYFLPYTHWVYLNEVIKYYSRVCLLSPTKIHKGLPVKGLVRIGDVENVEVYELPYSHGYIASLKYFTSYIIAYRKLNSFDSSYVRYPIPFGWLQKFFFKRKTRIIHFVGDPIDTIKNNPRIGKLRRWIYTIFFMPEHLLYMWACKGARVYTNGFHLNNRLKKFRIQATPLVSSPLSESDFYFEEEKKIKSEIPKLIYVGYLRKAKGVDTVLRTFSLVQGSYPEAQLTIVGSGESEAELKIYSKHLKLRNVNFVGHIDDRRELKNLFRCHDIFIFASLSEGSPRVILEAMANGLNVVSTPVGALSYIFEDGFDILFANYHEESDF